MEDLLADVPAVQGRGLDGLHARHRARHLLGVRPVGGASEIVTPQHFAAANAIGAAIAQVGGEVDRIFTLGALSREAALEQAKTEAIGNAVAAGADAKTVEVVDVEEVPLAYLPGNAVRIAVKAVGELAI